MSNKRNKSNAGRKSKYNTIIKPRLDEIAQMLKLGATDKEIAANLGIAKSTFCEYKNRYPEFKEFIKESRKKPVTQIKAALFKRATGFEYVEKKTESHFINFSFPDDVRELLNENGFDLDDWENPKITKVTTTTKLIVPDPASAMILLKHWAKDEGWTNDPQQLEIRKQELKLKEKQIELNEW